MKKINANDIAKWFLLRVDRDSGGCITHLKLQKLLYYAQAWYLANYKKPLFQEDFQAWSHGPVCAAIWTKYKKYTWEAIPSPKTGPRLEKKIKNYLESVWKAYGEISAKNLEKLTHSEDPWKNVRGNLPFEAKCTTIISKESMKNYYRKSLNDQRSTTTV